MKTLINLLLQEQSDLGLQRLLRSFCPKTYNRYGRCKILFPVSINKNWAACVSPSITINWLFSCNTLHLMSLLAYKFSISELYDEKFDAVRVSSCSLLQKKITMGYNASVTGSYPYKRETQC